jgi:hypothetical protein
MICQPRPEHGVDWAELAPMEKQHRRLKRFLHISCTESLPMGCWFVQAHAAPLLLGIPLGHCMFYDESTTSTMLFL